MDYAKLYKEIANINFMEIAYGRHKVLEQFQKLLPEIQQFLNDLCTADWGDSELQKQVGRERMVILKDIVQAYENGDEVLLMDTMAYGVQRYLKLFISDGDLE